MISDLFANSYIDSLVIGMELLVVGLIGLILVYILTKKQPRQSSRNSFLYILIMALIFYAIFYLKDPLEFIPEEIWNFANYAIIVITIYGFYRQIIGGFRAEFNDRLNDFRNEVSAKMSDFRTEIRRDFDRIEKKLEKIEERLMKSS